MSVKKRSHDNEPSMAPKKKKLDHPKKAESSVKSSAENASASTSTLVLGEVDFPRGGGSGPAPMEHEVVMKEGTHGDNEDVVFKDASPQKNNRKRRISEAHSSRKNKKESKTDSQDNVRIEQLNYKRIVVGMKILCQIISVQALALIVSLPNQLVGHVPITQISAHYTSLLNAMTEEEKDEPGSEEEEEEDSVPNLSEMFHPGQYVRAVVTAIRPTGTRDGMGRSYAMDETERTSRRVELSLDPIQVNAGMSKADFCPGLIMSGAVKSVEDHGYILDLGVSDVSGFLSFENAKYGPFLHPERIPVGRLVDLVISKLSDTGRTCDVTVSPSSLQTSSLKTVSNVTSLVPGNLVQSIVVDVRQSGLRLQVVGFYDGTVDKHNLPSHNPEAYTNGQKIKARVLYNVEGTSQPQFALSLLSHVIKLDVKRRQVDGKEAEVMQDAFPIGTILEKAKVVDVQPERGLIVEIEPGIHGFVHISHVSDDHVPSLSSSSGKWKVNSVHQARVTGYHILDGIIQLSLRPSVLEKKFLQVSDVHVGELVRGTVKHLSDRGLFVSMSGSIDGVVWPNHFADIPLKHPERRFKPGSSIKCRVLAVDPERKRILLTAKKTLVNSDLPIITNMEEAKAGLITYGTVAKVSEKGLIVEFYNHLKALVPVKEATETPTSNLSEQYAIGKPVKVRVISSDAEAQRIIASVRTIPSNVKPVNDGLNDVEIGQSVSGVVIDVHKDNIVLRLESSGARALISLKNLANHRGTTAAQLRTTLKKDDRLEELLVVSRNAEKGIVIVSSQQVKPTAGQRNLVDLGSIKVGDTLTGPVIRHGRQGTVIKISARITGLLHPTDTCDDYDKGMPFPAIDTVIRTTVIGINRSQKRISLSTRPSRLDESGSHNITDREFQTVEDLRVGDTVRGFIKNVAEHGIFVTLGREVDARVQIKELFDEYVKEWKGRFQVNQLVKGRIVSVDATKKQVEMSFRSGTKEQGNVSMGDLVLGQEVNGTVKKVEDYGIFIAISNSKLTGLCHKSEIADNEQANVAFALRTFHEGDQVKAVILSLDPEKKRISLGMKPSYFQDSNTGDDDEVDEADDEPETLGVVEAPVEIPDDESADENDHADGIQGDDTESEDEMEVDVIMPPEPKTMETKPHEVSNDDILTTGLSLGGFQWTNADDDSEDERYSILAADTTADEPSEKKSKKGKQVEDDLNAETDTRRLESTSDFERHLIGSPDSSYLWIRYMAFQIQFSEIDKAREIGKRAIQTINFRQEKEKLNVWIALLNLENTYGTDESLDATFKDAARHNDSKTVHLHLAAILDQSENYEKAEEHFKRTCKKFSQSSKVWTLFGEYYMRQGKLEEARSLLSRSLLSLDKRKHLKTISKFGQMEYKYGVPERGKSIFEGIVESHPKRWDLWSIYIDMEAGQKEILSVRNIFERVLSRKLTSYKAKSFFKKWLDIETGLGDAEGVQHVKDKAIEWTQNAVNAS